MTPRRSAIAACLAIFAAVAALVAVTDTRDAIHGVEASLMGAMRDEAGAAIGPAWLLEAVRDVSALGSMTVSIGVSLLAAGYFALRGDRRMALFFIAVIAGAVALASGAKELFARPRPDLFEHATRVFTQSFPSAHALVSAAVAAALAASLAAALAEGARTAASRRAVFAACGGIAFLIGASRVYLGVHWPTDVAAGWALGLAWTLLCIPLARRATPT